MKKLKTVMVSAAAMVDIDNKVLIAKRQKDKFKNWKKFNFKKWRSFQILF